MFPDLPGLKRDLQHVLDRYLQNRINQGLGIFGEVPKHFRNEGNRMRIVRPDGSVEETRMSPAKGEMALKTDEIPTLTLKDRIAKLDEIADRMADQIGTYSLKSLSEGLDKAGQVVDRKGKPFDAEAIFEVLEKIQIEFDESGKHNDLTILIPPALRSRAEEIIRSFQTDKDLQRRHDEIMARKREEWRDREAARKLVG